MDGQGILEGIMWEGGEGADRGVVKHENCDGLALIDLICELCLREEVVEGRVLGERGEDLSDVVGRGQREE